MLVGKHDKAHDNRNTTTKFFREGKDILQNMQDNMQARKWKITTKRLKKCTVSTQNDENQYQDRHYNSDDQYSDFEDAESVEAYVDKELDQDDNNDEMDDARNLNELKKERTCQQARSSIQDNLKTNPYFWVILQVMIWTNMDNIKNMKIWIQQQPIRFK